MITKENIRAQVVEERLAGVDEEVEKRYARLLEQRKLQDCGFHNNNIDELLNIMKESEGSNFFDFKKANNLPAFEFTSKDDIASGRYSFAVGNVMFCDALVYKKYANTYHCTSFHILVEKQEP